MTLKRSWLWTPALLLALAAVSYALYVWLKPPPLPVGLLYGAGRIEGTEVIIASEIAAQVRKSNLTEGKIVSEGEVLVELDRSDLQSQFDRAVADRDASLRERDRLRRELLTAQHHVETAQLDDRRYAALARDGTVPPQRREQAANALAEAQGRIASLEAAIAQVQARVQSLGESVALARSQLSKATISAPLTATVLSKSIEPGEYATPGRPIATLIDLSRVELKVYVPESDVGKVRLGGEARVRVDAFADRYRLARVARVDAQAQFTPRDIHMPDERARLVFGVTLSIDNRDGRLKPGMPADAWIRWDEALPWPAALTVPR